MVRVRVVLLTASWVSKGKAASLAVDMSLGTLCVVETWYTHWEGSFCTVGGEQTDLSSFTFSQNHILETYSTHTI